MTCVTGRIILGWGDRSWMLHHATEPRFCRGPALVDDGTVFGVFCTAQMTAQELGHGQAGADTQSQLT